MKGTDKQLAEAEIRKKISVIKESLQTAENMKGPIALAIIGIFVFILGFYGIYVIFAALIWYLVRNHTCNKLREELSRLNVEFYLMKGKAHPGPGKPEVPFQEAGEASRGNETPAQDQEDLPLHADCGFEGCTQKRLVYSNYFVCEFCGGYFCGDHRHVFHHNCPNIDEWKKRSSPSPVMGFIKGPWKEPKVIVNPQKRRFPQLERDSTAGDARTGDESAIDDSTRDLPGYQ
jgi:hypothetical protein